MSELTRMCSTTALLCLIFCFCCAPVLAQGDGDYDDDGDVDGDDFFAWAGCMTGPAGGPLDPGCDAFDFYVDFGPDGSVDMVDLWAFQRAPTGPGGCTLGRMYAHVSKPGLATGCFAAIVTRTNVDLCGEPTSSEIASSNAWVGVTKYLGTNHENWLWAQMGYKRFRNAGATNIQVRRYAETKGGLGPIIPGVNYDEFVGSAPSSGIHVYSCYLVTQVAGTWRYEEDEGVLFHQTTYPAWTGVTGTKYQWVAEILNKEDAMVGTPQGQGLGPCDFIDYKWIESWGGWQPANIQPDDRHTDDAGEWGIAPGLIPATQFKVWDVKPSP
ncbi:MAG: hypothetical protein IH988_02860 [Planctomycetes bacterium]|nr:hypothetical protein [Planctomycetota bacterium]